VSKELAKLFAFPLILVIVLSTVSGLSIQCVKAVPGKGHTRAATRPVSSPVTSVDLSAYARIGRFDLPEPTRTGHPPNSLLA